MKFAQANIRSVNTSIDLLLEASKKQEVDIFALSEIWHPKGRIEEIRRNWNWVTKERKDKQGGGVALMIRKNRKFYERKELLSEKLEAVWCNIYSTEVNAVVGSVYIPPGDKESIKELFRVVSELKKERLPIVLVGDINATHQYWGNKSENELGKLLFEFLCTHKDMHIVNNMDFTRKDRIIDLTIADEKLMEKITDWKVQEEVFLNSDHKLISFNMGRKEGTEKIEKWDFKRAEWQSYKEECERRFEDWETTEDVGEAYRDLCKIILEVADKEIRKKTICIHSKGWWSKELEQKAKMVRQRKRSFHRRSDQNNERMLEKAVEEFKEAENKAKEDYMQEVTNMLDPRDPQKFWKIINNSRKGGEKAVVQPILKGSGDLATSDEDMLEEFLEYYGKEVLEVEETDKEWFDRVEDSRKEEDRIQRQRMNEVGEEEFENREIYLHEVKAAVEEAKSNSAPNPEEKIYIEFIKHGGDNMMKALHKLFQSCWIKGDIPAEFKMDAKVVLPKQGKDNYNSVRSYRPITLESVVGKVYERVIAGRLRWKCEVEGIFAETQEAYRKNRGCTAAMGRMVQSLQEAKTEGKVSIVSVMDYESCFERVWRAGLMCKAKERGIQGRLWVYLNSYLNDRTFHITVNGKTSKSFTSKVGIPQGSVLSPFLCNIYTSDAMEEVEGNHSEFADDGSIWISGENIDQVVSDINRDLDKVANQWCTKWNMSVSAEKTVAMVVKPQKNYNVGDRKVEINGKKLAFVESKKILGITLDEDLSFQQHIESRTRSGFKALSSITHFGNEKTGCTQDTFLKLYKTLVLPVMDYGSPVLATAVDQAEKEFGKVQRKALLTATGCMSSTATEHLEVMTGSLPMSLHLKKKNAVELTRVYGKEENHPFKKMLQTWLEGTQGANTCMLKSLLSQFNELKGKMDLDHIESDFRYTKEGGLSLYREVCYVSDQEEMKNDKDLQAEKIEEVMGRVTDSDICVFSDGSAFGNPGPTGAGACVYMKGLDSDPVQLKQPVSPSSNNYVGELTGIHLGLNWLNSTNPRRKTIHIFVDCQPAIRTIFSNTLPNANIALVTESRQILKHLEKDGNHIHIHWTPGHKGIQGNEIADRLAKEAAKEMEGKPADTYSRKLSKKEIAVKMEAKVKDKWQRRYENSSNTNENFQDIFPSVQRGKQLKKDRKIEVVTNQIQTGHCKLNNHMSKIDGEQSAECEQCGVPETVNHYLFDCERFEEERNVLMRKIEQSMYLLQRQQSAITLRLLSGEDETMKELQGEIQTAFGGYLRSTGRLM